MKTKRFGALSVLTHPRAFVRFLRDGQAPLFPRLLALFAVLYVIMPIDLIPDTIPIVGWMDDIGIIGLVLAWTARHVQRYAEPALPAPAPPPAPTT
ncbi:MAG: YkvA family protein [Polyangiales bacterium]